MMVNVGKNVGRQMNNINKQKPPPQMTNVILQKTHP